MALYSYKALDATGRRVKGRMEALNTVDLELRLGKLELDLLFSKDVSSSKGFSFGGNAIKRRDLITFCFHLEQLTRAGVPLIEGLVDLRDSMDNMRFREVVANLIDEIEGGKQLSEALALHPTVFDSVFANLIHAGEISGQLSLVLLNLSEMLKWEDELAANTKKILMYPMFVGTVVTGVVFFLMIYLVPKLVSFIKTMGQELPFHTRALIAVSDFVVGYWWLILTAPIVTVVTIMVWAKKDPRMRFRVDGWKLNVWIVGPVLRKIILTRFTNFFALMYGAGISIMDSLKVSEGVVGNAVMADAIVRIRDAIGEGQGVAASFDKSRAFPPLVIRMLKVGENTGGLDTALRNVSYFYDRDVKESIGRVQAMIEPIMTVILGLILGWVMLSVLGPIYDTISKIK